VQTFIHVLDPYLPLSAEIAALLFLLFFLAAFVLYTTRVRRGARPSLRPLAAFDKLERLVDQAAETGRPVHVAVGTGQLGTAETPEALMGLVVLDYVARRAAVYAQPIMATTGDPASLPISQGLVEQALREAGFPDRYRDTDLSFYGPDPLAYSAGALDVEAHRHDVGAVLLGRFGVEGLWLAEGGAEPNRIQVGGTAQPDAIAIMQASLDNYLSGEEVFAAGAYLHRPSHAGGLQAQDALRYLVVGLVIVGVILASLGFLR